jgi:DNA polymerase-3 subunit alpha
MWVPLHVHSQYSILDALASIEAIAQKAQAFGMPACALTDHGNLYGAVDFYKACKEVQVKPLIGCEMYVAPESRYDKKKEYGVRNAYHLGLIAKNATGYRNLCQLSSIGFLEGFYYHPRIDREVLAKHAEGLICLSGCLSSRISYEALHGTYESLLKEIAWHRELFGDDFYIELQRHTMTEDEIRQDGMHLESWLLSQYQDYIAKQTKVNELLIRAASELHIKLIATNDSHYIERTDWRAHEIFLNIQSGEPCEIWEKDSFGNLKFKVPNPKRRTYSSHACYFKSPQEMKELFLDVPQAISNTLEVADKCVLTLDFKTKHYPVYTPPSLEDKNPTAEERAKSVEAFLWQLCREGIKKRYTPERLAHVKAVYPDKDPLQVVEERLQHEMSVIAPKGMCDYLLIVWDFIDWAKRNAIPVGPGRGSGAGSIVLYLIGVTDIEPLRFHLLFERFINPERISYPDIDVDICMQRRDEVISYVLHKYGKESIAQIITFGTMKARMTIKDVGRVLNVPLPKVNEIAKLVPEDLNITLEAALKDPELRKLCEEDPETQKIMEIGQLLEGSIRNTGIHAAGIIISGTPLTDLIPICISKDSEMPVTQYAMKPVESVGMLKIDFLGLTTLTAIQMAVDQIQKAHGKSIDWVNLPLDDAQTFDLLNQGKTLGVFQLESGGMQDLSRHLHLDRFEEIIAVGALYRPGPMDMIPSFIDRKHGRCAIENDHPWMQEILAETYGIMVYQEQVMQIASKLANFSLGEGDVLRRAMGKKDLEQMAKQREKFKAGALKNGIDAATSMTIFDKIEKFASYGFNKSHAAAYGYLSYVTAYLKANYPKEWMAALMTCVSHDLSKVAKFIGEAQQMSIPTLPPDVNESGKTFLATPQGVRFAMTGIKGIGDGVVEAILQERKARGHFRSLYDFIQRLEAKKVSKKTIETLSEAGAFDFTGWTRDALKLSIEAMYDRVSSEQKQKAQGYMSLFSLIEEPGSEFEKPPAPPHPRSSNELLLKERELLGFFLTGHPMDSYSSILKRLSCVTFSQALDQNSGTVFRSAFFVESVQMRLSHKTQRKFAILKVSDGVESIELPIWPELYEEKSTLLRENQMLYAVLQLEKKEEDAAKFSCRWLGDLTQASEEMIEECDRAFDKARRQTPRQAAMKSTPPPLKKPERKKDHPLSIKLDLEKIRLSHILLLRDTFEKHRGSTPVHIEFISGASSHGSLQVDPKWSVCRSPELENELSRILA